jgi:magnesium and cobalt exporter, CNNM family
MSATLWILIGAIAILLFLSGFFSGSETALTAASRARIRQLKKAGSKQAGLVERLVERKERLLGALLLGNNLVNILASAIATAIFIDLFGDSGVAYATLAMTALVVVFSEVLPKTWAITRPDNFALAVAPFLRPLVAFLTPFSFAIEKLVGAILALFGVDPKQTRNGLTGHDELRGAFDLLHHEGEVIKNDRDMLGGILDLSELEVSDVMVHRTRMMALDADLEADELVSQILDSPFTRIPLWRGDRDNIIGIIHAKNVLRALHEAGGDINKLDVGAIATKPWFVPDTTPLQDQLNNFLKGKSHFALVVDEYGEVEGLVTLEDILEEIVGDISDEYDEALEGARKQADGSYLIDGSLPIRDVNRLLEWDLPDEEATTMAGLVLHEAKMIPSVNQNFSFYGFRFRVTKKEHNRITELRVFKS